jgi:hypothetical protein
VFGMPLEPALTGPGQAEPAGMKEPVPATSAAARRIPASVRVPEPARQRLVLPGAPRKLSVRTAEHLVPAPEPMIEQVSIKGKEDDPGFDTFTREMVPV